MPSTASRSPPCIPSSPSCARRREAPSAQRAAPREPGERSERRAHLNHQRIYPNRRTSAAKRPRHRTQQQRPRPSGRGEREPRTLRARSRRRTPESAADRAWTSARGWPVLLAKAGEERRAARAWSCERFHRRSVPKWEGVRWRCVAEGLCTGVRLVFERERAARSEI